MCLCCISGLERGFSCSELQDVLWFPVLVWLLCLKQKGFHKAWTHFTILHEVIFSRKVISVFLWRHLVLWYFERAIYFSSNKIWHPYFSSLITRNDQMKKVTHLAIAAVFHIIIKFSFVFWEILIKFLLTITFLCVSEGFGQYLVKWKIIQ